MLFWLILQKLVLNYLKIVENSNQGLKNETTLIRKSNSGLELKKWIIVTLGILLTISALRGGVYRLISFFTVTLLRDFYNVGNFEAGVWTSVILLLGSGTDVYGAYTSDKSGAFGRVRVILISALGTGASILVLIFLTMNFITKNMLLNILMRLI